jgi:tellurite resistance-related uncharacterized protein
MDKEQELRFVERRESRIDEALKETFPASDPPSFIGAGARPAHNETVEGIAPRKADEMAGDVIDQHADLSASSEEQASRKRRLLKGPKEFRELRRDHPLTVHATAQMINPVERANQFRDTPLSSKPYKSTSVFDENTLPIGLRREHRTKTGVWGIIRVLHGRVRYQVLDPVSEVILEPGRPGLIRPDEPHLVEPLGPVRMQIEFYHQLPNL